MSAGLLSVADSESGKLCQVTSRGGLRNEQIAGIKTGIVFFKADSEVCARFYVSFIT